MKFVIVSAALVIACSHAKPVEEAQPVAPPPPAEKLAQSAPSVPQETPVAKPETAAQPKPAAPESIEPAASIYFAFDKSDLTSASRSRLQTLSEQASQPGAVVRIEGNCDERGTIEYNIALGQRRADAAKKYLVNLGVSAANITTISFGKERPKALGHDPESWRENRRDDLFVQPAAVSAR